MLWIIYFFVLYTPYFLIGSFYIIIKFLIFAKLIIKMIEENSKISLSYNLTGEYLVKRGKYSTAKVRMSGEDLIIQEPSKVIEKPEFADSHISITLPESFVIRALEMPKCPERKGSDAYHRWFRSDMGKLLLDWKKLNDVQKVERHIEMYIKDITGNPNPVKGKDYKFEII